MLSVKQMIDKLGDYYSLKREGIPGNQDLVQRIFDQLTQETYQSLGEAEKQILDRFYADVSNIPCSSHPEYVGPISTYHRILGLIQTPISEHSDSILRSWKESSALPE